MDEIALDQNRQDFEALSNFIPQWKQAQPEPFIQNPQTDVVLPTWNKITLPQSSFTGSRPTTQSEGTYITFNVIIGGQRYLADFDVINIRPA